MNTSYGQARELCLPRREARDRRQAAEKQHLVYDRTLSKASEMPKSVQLRAEKNHGRRASRLRCEERAATSARGRIFLLSPANLAGLRAKTIWEGRLRSPLAARLQHEGAPLGEIFSFISGLYFRGKLAYARAFAAPPAGVPGVLVITASGGLISPDTIFTIEQLHQVSSAAIDPAEPRYRLPLLRDARRIRDLMDSDGEVVLLGSIATPKYVEPLLSIFGERLLFPSEFVGRGDMSRGGLMLRCERAGTPLDYVPVSNAVLHGTRPARLPKMPASVAARLAVGSL